MAEQHFAKAVIRPLEGGEPEIKCMFNPKEYSVAKTDHQSGKKGRPPRVQFQWGEAFSFDAVITSITQKFTLFKENGVPVRATLDVGFQQIKDELDYPNQNPTSGGIGGGREWTVKEGDTLASIAYEEYGDSNKWRPIADANRLTQVRRLRPGAV